jgi:RNA polymerase sigma-70 factor (ECF subfamily)
MVGDRDDAEDVTQNVFIKASENLSKFDPKYRFFSWIYRITVNESINFTQVRKHQVHIDRLSDELAVEEKGPEEYAHDQHLARSVEDGVARLGENERIVIILRHFQELSYDEIGYILDLPVKTVRSRLYSARQNLKDILERRMVP